MKVPSAAILLAKAFEGLHLKTYICPAGFPTTGYGRVVPSIDYPPITKEQAELFLVEDMEKALKGAIKYCPILLKENENKLAAITDFVYNLGAGRLQASTLRRRVNEQNWPEAVKEINKWVYGGGRKLRGLELRRAAEAKLLL